MIVVADSSRLIVMLRIGLIHLLAELFDEVLIPPVVLAELTSDRRTGEVRAFFTQPHPWLKVCSPASLESFPDLHPGEIEALSLAMELRPDLLLVDDRAAYREAVARKIPAVGTLRVLELAAEKNLVNLTAAFDRIKGTDFWISHKLLDQRLQLHLARKGPGS